MRQRLTFLIGAITALALAAGAAWAAIPASVDSQAIIDVADAGSVTVAVDGVMLEITAIEAAAGWTHEIETAVGRQVEADFRNGDRRIQFDAELEGGEVRARIRERTQPAGGSTEGDATSSPMDDTSSTTGDQTPTTDDDTTSTTIDDDDDGPVESGSDSYSVGSVATVTIAWSGGRMSLVSVTVADGWTIEKQEVRSDRIEIEFESDDRDARFEADFHNGTIRVETRVD